MDRLHTTHGLQTPAGRAGSPGAPYSVRNCRVSLVNGCVRRSPGCSVFRLSVPGAVEQPFHALPLRSVPNYETNPLNLRLILAGGRLPSMYDDSALALGQQGMASDGGAIDVNIPPPLQPAAVCPSWVRSSVRPSSAHPFALSSLSASALSSQLSALSFQLSAYLSSAIRPPLSAFRSPLSTHRRPVPPDRPCLSSHPPPSATRRQIARITKLPYEATALVATPPAPTHGCSPGELAP